MGKANKQPLLIDLTSGYPELTELTKTQTQTDTLGTKPGYVRLQSSGWLKHEDISSNLKYNWLWLWLYKDDIFYHPLYVTSPLHSPPHPLLKLAPKAQKRMRERLGNKNGVRYEVLQKHVVQDTGFIAYLLVFPTVAFISSLLDYCISLLTCFNKKELIVSRPFRTLLLGF